MHSHLQQPHTAGHQRPKKLTHKIIGLLVAVIVVETLFHFAISPYLRVHKIVIRPDTSLAKDEIAALVGISTDTYYGEVQPAQIEQILLSHPSVVAAKVKKQFPSTVVINLTERIPVGVIIHPSSLPYYFDKDGVVYSADQRTAPQSLIVLSGLEQDWYEAEYLPLQLHMFSKNIALLYDQFPTIYQAISEVAVTAVDHNYHEALLYFSGIAIPVRISTAITVYQFNEIWSILNTLSEKQSAFQISEIDFRSGEAVIRFHNISNG